MKKLLLISSIFALSACSFINTPLDTRKALHSALHENMTKAELLARLGEPYKIEHLSTKEEIIYYETDMLAATFCLQYTAIKLMNNKVSEWGSQVCKEPSPISIDNRLDNHLKQ